MKYVRFCVCGMVPQHMKIRTLELALHSMLYKPRMEDPHEQWPRGSMRMAVQEGCIGQVEEERRALHDGCTDGALHLDEIQLNRRRNVQLDAVVGSSVREGIAV